MAPKTPFLHPKRYFDQNRDALTPGLAVFAVYIIGTAVTLYAIVNLLFNQAADIPPEAREALNRILPSTLVILFITAIIALLLIAFIMHVFNSADAAGRFTDAIAVAGWAYAPNILALPITYLETHSEIRQMSLDGSNPEVFQSQLEAVQNSGSSLLSIIVLLCVCAWSVYILAYGVAATHDTSVDKAIFPALIVGVGAFLLGI